MTEGANLKRRRGPDIWVRLVNWVGAGSWFVIFLIVFILTKAGPQQETFLDRIKHVDVRTTWDLDLAQYGFFFMVFLFILDALSIIINSRRMKRKSDKYNKSVITSGSFALIGIIIYVINFYID